MVRPVFCPSCQSRDITYLPEENPLIFEGHNSGYERTIECNNCEHRFFTLIEVQASVNFIKRLHRKLIDTTGTGLQGKLSQLVMEDKLGNNSKKIAVRQITDFKELAKLRFLAEPDLNQAIASQVEFLKDTNPALFSVELAAGKTVPRLEGWSIDEFGYWGSDSSIKGLNLADQKLFFFPSQVFEFPNLRTLYLHNIKIIHGLNRYFHQLQELPAAIGKLKRLEKFSVDNNAIRQVPDEICQLTELTELRLHSNQLREIPENIGDLKNLRILTLNHNYLQTLPESITELKYLHTFSIDRELAEQDDVKPLLDQMQEHRGFNYINLL